MKHGGAAPELAPEFNRTVYLFHGGADDIHANPPSGSTSCAESRYEDEIHDLPLGQMSGLVRINDVLLNGFAQDSQGFHSGAIVRNTDGDAISLLFCL